MWIVISGHGEWAIDKTFEVPAGKTIKFFSEHGVPTYVNSRIDAMAAAAKSGEDTPDKLNSYVVEVVKAGQDCHDYILTECRDVNPREAGKALKNYGFTYKIQKHEKILLSDALAYKKVAMCDTIYVYACRSFSKKAEKLLKARAEEDLRDIDAFLEDRVKWAAAQLDALSK